MSTGTRGRSPKRIVYDHNADGVNRRGFLECMAWAGTGLVWTVSGGVATSRALGQQADTKNSASFVQLSDSHVGFNKPVNPDVVGTLQTAVDRINALPQRPAFVIHTGDLTHSSKPNEFDTVNEVLKSIKTDRIFYVPGEHDTSVDDGKSYLERYGKGSAGRGWYSFDHQGTRFIGLVNVAALDGIGKLGADQLEWLRGNLEGVGSSTPIVVFAHIPLWTVYQDWGWATEDSAQAMTYLRRFGAVTVLNGHIHQVLQKVEGNVTFHTGMSTAFPQPKPGEAHSAGPMKVPAERLRSYLGLANVRMVTGKHSLAVVDSTLEAAASATSQGGSGQ